MGNSIIDSEYSEILDSTLEEDPILSLANKSLKLSIDHTFPNIKDHFPENPLVPAFVQLLWAHQLFSACFPELVLKKVTSVKFKAPIIPPSSIEVSLTENNEFKISSSGKLCTTGKILT